MTCIVFVKWLLPLNRKEVAKMAKKAAKKKKVVKKKAVKKKVAKKKVAKKKK